MIVWINGTYGVGKTEVTRILKKRLSVTDIELLELDNYSDFIMGKIVKNFQKSNNTYSDIDRASSYDIQYYEEFRRMIEEKAHKTLIVDTAIMDKACKNIIFEHLSEKYDDLLHIILIAEEETIRLRIQNDNKRKPEDKSFALVSLKNNISFMDENFKEAIRIKTDNRDVESVVDEIIELIKDIKE